jgi:hypothetical protein
MTAAKETTLESLAKLVAEASASAERSFSALAEDNSGMRDNIGDIKSTFATEEDVRTIVNEELAPIRSELKTICDELDDLSEAA